MRTIFLLLCLSFFGVSANSQVTTLSSQARSVENERESNYVVLTRNTAQLPAIFAAAKELAGRNMGIFEVILCGDAVRNLKEDPKLEEYIKMTSDLKINMMLCGMSLKQYDIDPEQYNDLMKVVENGVLHNLKMQQKGFYSLSL